ncbi:MAG: ABC transporter ATP-binding protein [Phycisphaerae bacterium]|nr:ABC transporter ATP-binding protein [Phycisphaerae bacterium]NUQ47692.1 ABC transporter ATP-binding protein [Phycisphaerae bacterium]
MSPIAVRVQSVSKSFRRGDGVDTLRELLTRRIGFGRARDRNRHEALRDVSFEVRAGEAFGVIGPNGAGKSTLLKLLAGLLRPDAGDIETARPVSALIELGAGFQDDLSGRENIGLNAAIMGLPRRELLRRFDSIVAFAGIGDFLDTPVKRYSSGMRARLGFAIAAHVEPRVLLVDEVLSVGDAVFRRRCTDKMREFLKRGTAVVFVSHDLGAVQRFCDRALLLERGRPAFTGPAHAAVARYQAERAEPWLATDGDAAARVMNVRVLNGRGALASTFEPGQQAAFEFDCAFTAPLPHPAFGVYLIRTRDHLTLFETSSDRMGHAFSPGLPGHRQHVRFDLTLNVAPGEYALGYHVRDRDATRYAALNLDAARLRVNGCAHDEDICHSAATGVVTI